MSAVNQRCDGGPIALMGGSYGNVPALTACIAWARQCGCQHLAFLGDAIGCCGHSDEVLQLLADNFDMLVAGNHEQQAAAGAQTCGCGYADPDDERLGCLAYNYAVASLSESNRNWIATWPDQAFLATPAGRVLLCHGSPDNTNEFLYESRLDDARLNAWLDHADAVAMVCTHTGLPWVRQLDGGRLAVNCGAVGKPDHDGDLAVHFAVLQLQPTLKARIERVTYDAQSWANQLAEEGVDPVFITPLTSGRWTAGRNSLPPREREQSP
ncbi:MAG: metallophosphoesterase family protein [Proteobacteria bacterium]|nr:metallophosphoesterase family protein [Pseudomonadota bacterium]